MSNWIMMPDVRANYSEVLEWWDANPGSTFASSLKEQAERYGRLSQKQVFAAMAAAERWRNAPSPAQQEAAAPEVSTSKLEQVFQTANRNLRKPALTVGSYRFSPAPDTGKNPGAIYVKHEGQYLGKMLRGKFLARCTEEAMREVLDIANDPLGKAIEHGKLTGRCAICSRKLTDTNSVDRGIGPICAAKFGWELQ